MDALFKKKKAALAAQYTFDSVAFRSYRDSIKLRIAGQWRDAGDKLCRSAEQYTQNKMFTEAASLYCEAVECYLKIDKNEALRVLSVAVKAHCDIGKFDIAGRLERKIADIHYRIKHYDDAAIHYRKASNFLSGNQEIEGSDLCLELCAECLLRNNEVKDVFLIYETVAASYVNSNLRRFHARKKLFKAMICIWGTPMELFGDINAETLAATKHNASNEAVAGQDPATVAPVSGTAHSSFVVGRTSFENNNRVSMGSNDHTVVTTVTDDDSLASASGKDHKKKDSEHIHIYEATCNRRKPKYDEIAIKLEEYESIDFLWRGSKEKLFFRNLLQFRLELDIDQFVDHLYFWNSMTLFDETALTLLEIPLREMESEIGEKKAHDDAKEAKRLAALRGKRLVPPK